MNLREFFFYWGPVFAWCLLIFILSSIPTLPKVGFIWWDFVLKKTAHMIEYAVLYFLVWRVLARQGTTNKKIWILPFIFGTFYALSDEYHQAFVAGRTSTIRDVGFDILGMMISYWWLKKKMKSEIKD